MGAQSFTDSGWIVRKPKNAYSDGDFFKLFKDLQREADEEYGYQGGESGQINAKDDYAFCGAMTTKQYDVAKKWWGGSVDVDKAPKFLRDRGLAGKWDRAGDRDGAVCMVVLTDQQQDTSVVTKKTLGVKNIIPAANREKLKYEIEYRFPNSDECTRMCGTWSSFRAASASAAWKQMKIELAKHPNIEFGKIKHSYTYATPEIKSMQKKAKLVRVKAFGVARW